MIPDEKAQLKQTKAKAAEVLAKKMQFQQEYQDALIFLEIDDDADAGTASLKNKIRKQKSIPINYI